MLDKIITQLAQNDPALTELDLNHVSNNSGSDEIQTFLRNLPEALKNNQYVTELILEHWSYEVRGESLKTILGALGQNTCLTILNLNSNNINHLTNRKGGNPKDASAIANLLAVNTCLTILNLDYNKIGPEGVKLIGEALKKNNNTRLEELTLYQNQIGDEGAEALATLLKEPSSLTVLDIGHNRMSDKGMTPIAKALKTNIQLEELHLYLNQIGNQGTTALAIAVENNPNTQLKVLDLGLNGIQAEGAKAIASMLSRNISLTHLDLFNNEIGDKGTIVIANALKKNAHLEVLNLRYNDIGDAGAKAIAEMLTTNTTLKKLNLYNNQIGDNGIEAIVEAVKKNPCLKELNLGANKIGAKGAYAIARMLAENSCLEVLNLKNSQNIDQEGLSAILEALKKNTHLTELSVHNIGKNHPGTCSIGVDPNSQARIHSIEEHLKRNRERQNPSSTTLLETEELLKSLEKTPKEEKSAKFPWGKLALFLVVASLVTVISLSVVGLFLSLWTIAPAVPLLIGIFIGIKVIYDAYQQKQSVHRSSLLVPDEARDKSAEETEKEQLLISQKLTKKPAIIRPSTSTENNAPSRKSNLNQGVIFLKTVNTSKVKVTDEGEKKGSIGVLLLDNI